jgi:hypothetical protein
MDFVRPVRGVSLLESILELFNVCSQTYVFPSLDSPAGQSHYDLSKQRPWWLPYNPESMSVRSSVDLMPLSLLVLPSILSTLELEIGWDVEAILAIAIDSRYSTALTISIRRS